jgi:hypothetical protein
MTQQLVLLPPRRALQSSTYRKKQKSGHGCRRAPFRENYDAEISVATGHRRASGAKLRLHSSKATLPGRCLKITTRVSEAYAGWSRYRDSWLYRRTVLHFAHVELDKNYDLGNRAHGHRRCLRIVAP